jgi:hypothetical protein
MIAWANGRWLLDVVTNNDQAAGQYKGFLLVSELPQLVAQVHLQVETNLRDAFSASNVQLHLTLDCYQRASLLRA